MQYDHIRQGIEARGESEDNAEEIAARTVNKERARSGDAEAQRKGVKGRSKMTKKQLEKAVGR